MAKIKDSNFELLKIISMLMIICHHLGTYNAFNIDSELVGLNLSRLYIQLIGNFAFVGNNLFFMVSAWFLCKKNESFNIKVTIKRIWNIEKIMLFYSIFIPFFFYFSPSSSGVELFQLKNLFPLVLCEWWYPTSYAIFLVFFPFYQQGLLSLNKDEVKKLILVMLCIWVVPTIIPIRMSLGADKTTCFFMLYAIIFYIRNFNPKLTSTPKFYKGISIGGVILAFLSIIFLDIVGYRIDVVNKMACYYIRGNWRMLPVIISLGIFLWSIHWKPYCGKLINILGSATFAVYLIHMHPVVAEYLFKHVFVIQPYIGHLTLVPYIIGVTILIFLVCSVIDIIRNSIYNKLDLIYSKIKSR